MRPCPSSFVSRSKIARLQCSRCQDNIDHTEGIEMQGLPSSSEAVQSKQPDDTSEMSTTIIHAYNSPGPQTSQEAPSTSSSSSDDTWKTKASSLLCCFSSAGYYLEQSRARIGQPWASGTGELQVFADRVSATNLLGPQSPENEGRMTLILDLDGAIAVAHLLRFPRNVV